jgi:hypothetical protein
VKEKEKEKEKEIERESNPYGVPHAAVAYLLSKASSTERSMVMLYAAR